MNSQKSCGYLFIVLVLPVLFLSCNDSINSEDWQNSNTPAIGNTTNSFAFAIAANNFSIDDDYPVNFNTGSLSLGLAITNFRNGGGKLEFINSRDSVFYSVSLNSNMAYGNKDITGEIPAKIHISLTNFSGQLSIGVAGK